MNAIQTIPCVQRKAEWALKWANPANASFAERLVAFAAVEAIFFSGSFCSIFWIKKRNMLPGLIQANQYISRDEKLHWKFACLMYSKLEFSQLSRERVLEIILDAESIEEEFVSSSLPVSLIGMNSDLMKEYIQYITDRLLNALGYESHFNVTCPFSWMEKITFGTKSNMFEHKITEYSKSGVGNNEEENIFSLDASF